MPHLIPLALLLGLLAGPAPAADLSPDAYGFPLSNPFEATIAGTPPDLRPELPGDDEISQATTACSCARSASTSCRPTSGR